LSEPFWTDPQVRRALGLEGGGEGSAFRAVSTDTRTIGDGDLFVALKGERFDGHEYLAAAAAAGATGFVISNMSVTVPDGTMLYAVPDTLTALGQLAAHRRSALEIPFVGVVGSNGKTTTKELIRSVLQMRYRTSATAGNQNNLVGVPQTLLAVPDDAEAVVVEMGTDRPGEIAMLTSIVRPDHVVITAIGEEHLEFLGDLDGVLQEETSVLHGLAPAGKAFVADEPDSLVRKAREIVGRKRVRLAGWRDGAELRPDGGETGIHVLEDGSTIWRWRGVEVRLPIPGRINVRNALLALGVGLELGVHSQDAVRGLAQVKLPKLRGEWVRIGEMRVLADCYNANPPSVAAAIDLLASLPTRGRRIAVLGTMRELGSASDPLHSTTADRIAKLLGDRIDLVVATGDFAAAFAKHTPRHGDHLVISEDSAKAFEEVRDGLRDTDTILLKASRGDRLERWLDFLEEREQGKQGA